LVDLLGANHASRATCRLCEQLLFRMGPGRSPADSSGTELQARGVGGHQEKRLLLKYVHTLTDSLQQRQGEVERRLAELERWRRRRSGNGLGSKSSCSLADEGSSPRSNGLRLAAHLPAWARHPALVGSCMILVAIVPLEHPAGRVLRAAPLLALLPRT
jgi:hypothetical protein